MSSGYNFFNIQLIFQKSRYQQIWRLLLCTWARIVRYRVGQNCTCESCFGHLLFTKISAQKVNTITNNLDVRISNLINGMKTVLFANSMVMVHIWLFNIKLPQCINPTGTDFVMLSLALNVLRLLGFLY